MKILFFAFTITLLISGCAVMDTSVLDSAEPLMPGKVKLETYASTGVILESTVYDEDIEYGESAKAVPWPVWGFKLGVGIADKAEVGAKGWITGFSLGSKTYLKYLFHQEGKDYYSVIPAITYAGVKEDNEDYNDASDFKYKSIGFELPILMTRKLSEEVSLTAAARMNYNFLEYEYQNTNGSLVKNGPFNVLHGGILVNARAKLWAFVLCPEVGVEIVPVVNGDITVLPNYGVSVGLQF
jgi:hypothetical protein